MTFNPQRIETTFTCVKCKPRISFPTEKVFDEHVKNTHELSKTHVIENEEEEIPDKNNIIRKISRTTSTLRKILPKEKSDNKDNSEDNEDEAFDDNSIETRNIEPEQKTRFEDEGLIAKNDFMSKTSFTN